MPPLPRALLLLLILTAGAMFGFWALTGPDASRQEAVSAEERDSGSADLSAGKVPDDSPDQTPDTAPASPPEGGVPDSDPPPPAQAVDLAVAMFRGRVVDAFDTPLRGCRVLCEPAPDEITVAPRTGAHAAAIRVTEADGKFELSVAADAQDLVFSFDHPDFEPRVAALRRLGPAGSGVHALGEFVLRSGTGLESVVIDADSSQPVVGAQVRLRPEVVDPTLPPVTLAILERTASTDLRGRAVFGGLTAGSYLLRFESDDHVALERHTQHPRPTGDPSDPQAAHALRAELTPSVVLRGRLISADGDPIQGGVLRAHPRDAEFGAATAVEGVSGETGDFRIPRLTRGAYCLTVDTPNHGAHQIADLIVPAGSPFTVRMDPRSELSGVVRRPGVGTRRGRPAEAGLRVELRALASEPILRRKVWFGTTDVDGSFAIGAIPPGRYAARASSDAPRAGAQFRGVVTLPCEPVDWTLRSTIRLRGRVAIDGPTPRGAVSARIRIMPIHRQNPIAADAFSEFATLAGAPENADPGGMPTEFATVTDIGGRFVVEGLERVPIRLEIHHGASPPFVSRRLDLQISPGAREFDAGEIRLPWTELVSIRGSVVTPDGSPIPGATVALTPASPEAQALESGDETPTDLATGIADAFGRFTLESIPAGRYLLRGVDALRAGSAGRENAAACEVPIEVPLDARQPIRLELTPAR